MIEFRIFNEFDFKVNYSVQLKNAKYDLFTYRIYIKNYIFFIITTVGWTRDYNK